MSERPQVLSVVRGSMRPSVGGTFTDTPTDPWDLTNANVMFVLNAVADDGMPGDYIMASTAQITDAATRQFIYEWKHGDTDLPVGEYYGMFVIEFTESPDASPVKVPTNDWIRIRITPALTDSKPQIP